MDERVTLTLDVLISIAIGAISWKLGTLVFPAAGISMAGAALLCGLVHLFGIGLVRTDDIDTELPLRSVLIDHAFSGRISVGGFVFLLVLLLIGRQIFS